MRVCVVTTSFPRSVNDDAGVFVMHLVEALSIAGHSGVVIVPKDAAAETLEHVGTFAVIRPRYGVFRRGMLAFGAGIIPNLRARPTLMLQAPLLLLALLWKMISARSQYDVIHANWIITALPACAAALICRKPFVVTVRGEDTKLLRIPVVRTLCIFALKRAQSVITVSESLHDEFLKLTKLPAERISTIANGVALRSFDDSEFQRFLQTRELDSPGPVLVFIGTVIPRKRIDFLIRLLAEPALQAFTLLICGRIDDEKETQRLKSLAHERGCTDRIRFEGVIDPRLVPLYLKRAEAYLSAAAFEGRPNSVLEAMAAGCPVILSDIPSHREMVEEGSCGILFPVDDHALAAREIGAALMNKEFLAGLAEGARRKTAPFTWDATARAYEHQYQSALGS